MFFFCQMFLTRSVKKKNVFDRFRLEIFNFLGGLVKTVRKIKVFSKKTLGGGIQSKWKPPPPPIPFLRIPQNS